MSDIEFPSWVKITACERQTRSFVTPTAHGVRREEYTEVTDHGALMVVWRARNLVEPDPAEPRPAVVWSPSGRRFRKVPATVTAGRYGA